MSVMNIYERAQIGALIRYRDFAPQPSVCGFRINGTSIPVNPGQLFH